MSDKNDVEVAETVRMRARALQGYFRPPAA